MRGQCQSFLFMRDVMRRIEDRDASEFIVGETGAGKELAARELDSMPDREPRSLLCGVRPA